MAWTNVALDTSGMQYHNIDSDADGYLHVVSVRSFELYYGTNVSGSWVWSLVDDSYIWTYADIAIDSSGTIHICAMADSDATVRYVYGTPGSWSDELIDDAGDSCGWYCKIVLDGSGRPNVVYQVRGTAPNYYLGWGRRDGGSWTIEYPGGSSLDSHGYSPGIDIDSSGAPHVVCYYNDGSPLLWYAYRTGSDTWSVTTGTGPGTPSSFCALALDSDDYPYIPHFDTATDDLGIWYQDAGGWHGETVDSADYCGYDVTILIDDDDKCHIAHFRTNGDSGRYAYGTPGSWTLEQISTTSSTPPSEGWKPSITLVRGTPVVTSWDATNTQVEISCRTLNVVDGWKLIEIEDAGGHGRHITTAVMLNGCPLVAWYDQTNGRLRLWQWDSGGGSVETVDSDAGGYAGYTPRMKVDPDTGTVYIVYTHYDGSDYHVRYAHGEPGSWSFEDVYTQTAVSDADILPQGTDPPLVVFRDDHANTNLRLAEYSGGSWGTTIVGEGDSAGWVADHGISPRIAKQADGTIWVWGVGNYNGGTRVRPDGGSFGTYYRDTWPTSGARYRFGCMCLRNDTARIAVAETWDGSTRRIRGGYWVGGGGNTAPDAKWEMRTVSYGYYPSLISDGAGTLHLAHAYSSGSSMTGARYGVQSGPAESDPWSLEWIYYETDAAQGVAIALLSDDSPAVAFFDEDDGVVFAYKNDPVVESSGGSSMIGLFM